MRVLTNKRRRLILNIMSQPLE